MRKTPLIRICSAATVAILATGGALASTATASAAAKHAKLESTSLSIKNKVIAKGKHHADMITGVLRHRHTGISGETITLDSRTGKKPRWAAVGTGTTGSDGSVSFTVSPTVKTQFKLVFAGDSSHRKSHSNVITLKAVKK